ncbi:hypothetical protein J3A64_001731 [Pseudarthrobacter sp. PvP004]|uniref:hypothetical protein n=1 Tax=Pseudarthrobacter sp. PvP004 TaxID=2817850 RepID=UPI001AEB95D6|nr:hypothetical protein [Pseudarthrobacter sp. PvP004]MBP2266267.1 hypothetical protein [Pseudarthrobacter sp. PvP004]
MKDPAQRDRLKFYGPHDVANAVLVDEAVALIRAQSGKQAIASMNDALEVYNALEFERLGVLPRTLTQEERDTLATASRVLRGQIAAFFSKLDSLSIDEHLNGLDREYTLDVLLLIGRYKVAKNVGGQALFDALVGAGIPLWAMLEDKPFVEAHDRRLRDALLADARCAELLVKSHLIKNSSDAYALPKSLTTADSQQILQSYIDSESPHLNYVEAIANAQDKLEHGITPKIRLAAQRRKAGLVRALFEDKTHTSMSTGYAVGIDLEQREPVLDRVERKDTRTLRQRTFGGLHLKSSMESLHVLANFRDMVGYSEGRGLLAFPSFRSQIGTLEGLRVSGKDAYPRGGAFAHRDCLTILGTEAYYDFLQREGVEVEDVIAWYFREYLPEVFDAAGFEYAPSTASSTYLERCRHICAEMESVTKQFTLYCEDGELDRELLQMTSAPRPWGNIPSLVDQKHLIRAESRDCDAALHLLFNDQSRITYVNKELRARTFVELVLTHEVSYTDLIHYQVEPVDWLIAEGLMSLDDGVICFSSLPMIRVLQDVHKYGAGPFGHYGFEESAAVSLVERGWLEFGSTLLTSAEASYFNFFLNKSEFSDGHDLRNRYLHGTNADPRDESAHRTSYLQLLRLMVSLVLKIEDDFFLHRRSQS